ncbi:MAG: DNA mismatch repair endonuclease MutL [Clostridia bacterium]|nr:DNA mismatch repair endonuclease MutL [Clostridia bacterium]
MKINVLDKKLFSMISAGEVVEKPASVVKELVENSIDAGATEITIEVEEGGINTISITDNGCGIEKEDVVKAFLPHATSKISAREDLDAIATLGFRGEALSSIQAVSEVVLTTKTVEAEIGTLLVMSAGEAQETKECAFNKGTKIVVKNLFLNTPARKKFLNRPKIEENEITKIVERFMLSYPKIKFKYFTNGKMMYSTLGTNLFDNIYLIYGKEIADNLIKVDFQEGDYALEGYISRPEISKPNKSFIVSFINGRMVKDIYMENAIIFAYQDYLMHGNFPICFLNFKIPFESVDVNIHPSKQEVKYENSREITTFFIKALEAALEKSQCQKFDEIFGIKNAFSMQKETIDFKKEAEIISSSYGISYKKDALNLEASPNEIFNVNLSVDQEDDNYDMTIEEEVSNIEDVFNKSLNFEETQETFIDEKEKPLYKIIGTAFNTYIFLEVGEKILVVDQHACHERKLYDKFMQEMQNNQIGCQMLLYPYSFKTSTEESTFFLNHLDDFLSLGINIVESGPNLFRIIEVPTIIRDIDFKEFILSIKQNLNGSKLSIKSLLKDFLAITACKAAVKAGDKLCDEDIESLLKDLENHKILRCPHGRPFVYEITKREIEKWFKRIV